MPAIRMATKRLPLHSARRAPMMSMMRALRLRRHRASGTIRRIARRATPATSLERAPVSLAREDGVMEAVERACACTVDEGRVAEQGNVVEAEVPDGCVNHAVGAEGHHRANNGAGEDVIPGIVR
jgi:hypothetical protein